MNFFKKLFKRNKPPKEEIINPPNVNLSLEHVFVNNFIAKGGKFLYCISENEIINNLTKIISENNWNTITCFDNNIEIFLKKSDVNIQKELDIKKPFFTTCEHLISDNGDILFSSNQLSNHKISSLTEDFIVFAKTSQFVKDRGEGLTGIKTNYKEIIPTNISAIRKYSFLNDDDNFLNYGDNNSKNLYLLLLEDL
tara:strand:- start:13373 stop:13960 length:588 start_codon:yes stop_codon:yes gene_type:complete